MSFKRPLLAVVGLALCALQAPTASAVGNGLGFVFRELFVPADQHPVSANSLDFTYHSCVDFVAAGHFVETGYLWISSFQDVDSVVDSQINYYQANGYHLYAKYSFSGDQCSSQMTCPNGQNRRNYGIEQATFELYVDPLSDTVISNDCAFQVSGNVDDRLLGTANAILPTSMKSETNDVANGDFEIEFFNWAFTADGQQLFRDGNGNPLFATHLVFNANVTGLNGPLTNDHKPEGSGNLFWRD
jgi:hypothetical protein